MVLDLQSIIYVFLFTYFCWIIYDCLCGKDPEKESLKSKIEYDAMLIKHYKKMQERQLEVYHEIEEQYEAILKSPVDENIYQRLEMIKKLKRKYGYGSYERQYYNKMYDRLDGENKLTQKNQFEIYQDIEEQYEEIVECPTIENIHKRLEKIRQIKNHPYYSVIYERIYNKKPNHGRDWYFDKIKNLDKSKTMKRDYDKLDSII